MWTDFRGYDFMCVVARDSVVCGCTASMPVSVTTTFTSILCSQCDMHRLATTELHVHVHDHISETHQKPGKATQQHVPYMYMHIHVHVKELGLPIYQASCFA